MTAPRADTEAAVLRLSEYAVEAFEGESVRQTQRREDVWTAITALREREAELAAARAEVEKEATAADKLHARLAPFLALAREARDNEDRDSDSIADALADLLAPTEGQADG